jgi:hypothetical protein
MVKVKRIPRTKVMPLLRDGYVGGWESRYQIMKVMFCTAGTIATNT